MSRLETSLAPAIRATLERSRESSLAVTPGPGLAVAASVGAIAAQAITAMKMEICTFFIVVSVSTLEGTQDTLCGHRSFTAIRQDCQCISRASEHGEPIMPVLRGARGQSRLTSVAPKSLDKLSLGGI
ncbi:MAG TPA: hypothetical protein VEW47_12590 [Candidatus Dormibacteraeota bacterium]|nr:hypothetical protein [Candidatus Dormibacteraeota bacterium]